MKYKNKKIHFITYSDDKNNCSKGFTLAKKRILNEAKNSKFFTTYKGYNYNDLPDEFKIKYNKTLTQFRGGGYWIWKYKIIEERLKDIDDGDFLIYCDAGCTVNRKGNKRFYEYLDMLNNSKYGIIYMTHSSALNIWTNKEIFHYFNEIPDNPIGLERCCCPGVLIVQKKPHIYLILNEFEKLLDYDQKLVTDYYSNNQKSYFKENRHDQSIFTFLFIKFGAVIINSDEINVVGNEYYPFWATRIRN